MAKVDAGRHAMWKDSLMQPILPTSTGRKPSTLPWLSSSISSGGSWRGGTGRRGQSPAGRGERSTPVASIRWHMSR